jgi:hypothetical protein
VLVAERPEAHPWRLLTARPISGDWKLRAHTRGRLKRLKASRRGALDVSSDSVCAGVRVCGRVGVWACECSCEGPGCECRWLHGLERVRCNGATRPSPDPPRAAGRGASADQGLLCWAQLNQPGQPPASAWLPSRSLHSTAASPALDCARLHSLTTAAHRGEWTRPWPWFETGSQISPANLASHKHPLVRPVTIQAH